MDRYNALPQALAYQTRVVSAKHYVLKGEAKMSFGNFRLEPKPQHIIGVLSVLHNRDILTPQEIATDSGLTLTQVRCALNYLETTKQVKVLRQNTVPKVRVALLK